MRVAHVMLSGVRPRLSRITAQRMRVAVSQSDALTNKLAWLQVACTTECNDVCEDADECPSGRPCNLLHYVPGEDDATWEAWWDVGPFPKDRTAVCGAVFAATLPGMFSRMGAPRCDGCCTALAITPGKGAAMNDDTCRPTDVSLAVWLQRVAATTAADARDLYVCDDPVHPNAPEPEDHWKCLARIRQNHAARQYADARAEYARAY